MQIVIDIDDNLYTRLFDNGVDNYDDAVDMAKAIRKGTPLPKGHGRLIDADKIESTLHNKAFDLAGSKRFYEINWAHKMVCGAPTIIEADKESEDKEVDK